MFIRECLTALIAVVFLLLGNATTKGQLIHYRFTGVLPAGASSHSEVADGERFTVTYVVDTSIPDSSTDPQFGVYFNAVISGTLEFSGGYSSPIDLGGSSIYLRNGIGTPPSDGVYVGNSGANRLIIQAATDDLSTLSSDALPDGCVTFSSAPATLPSSSPTFLYSDVNGEIRYNLEDANNVDFLSYEDDLWIDPTGGYFDEGFRWSDGSAPGAGASATFGLPIVHTVNWDSLTGNVANRNLCVAHSILTFRSVASGGGGPIYTYSATGDAMLDSAVFILGGSTGDSHNVSVGDDLLLNDSFFRVDPGSSLTVGGQISLAETNEMSTMTFDDATFNATGVLLLSNGMGTINALDGSVANTTDVRIGASPGADGYLLVSGEGTVWNSTVALDVGEQGEGSLRVDGGATVHSRVSAVGVGDGGEGTATISGPGSTWIVEDALTIGFVGNSTGELSIDDGGLVSCDGTISINYSSSNPNNRVDIAGFGSTLVAAQDITIGDGGHGELVLAANGRVEAGNNIYIGPLGTLSMDDSVGLAEIEAGNQILNEGLMNLTVPGPDIYGNVVNAGFIQSLGDTETYFYDNVQHNSGFIFTGAVAETRIFGAASGPGRYTGSGDVVFQSSIRPGIGNGINSAGTMSLDGNMLQTVSTETHIEIFGTEIGSFDRLTVAGDVQLDGTLLVFLRGGFTPSGGQEFIIAEVGGTRSGTFIGLAEAALVGSIGGTDVFITYTAGDGNDIALYTTEEVQVIAPDSLVVTRGVHASGGIAELAESDNNDVGIQRSTSDIQAMTEFEVKSVSPTEHPAQMEVTLEGAVFARSGVTQTIQLFNYEVGDWETVDSCLAQRLTDSVVNVVLAGDLSRFVEPGTRCIEARIQFRSMSPRQQFSSNTDQFIWLITN